MTECLDDEDTMVTSCQAKDIIETAEIIDEHDGILVIQDIGKNLWFISSEFRVFLTYQ